MEHRGSLVIGLLGFGFVAYVLIRAASMINTHPDLDHFVPTPTKRLPGEIVSPDPTPTIDPVAAQLVDDSEVDQALPDRQTVSVQLTKKNGRWRLE